jgi:hypothetical protein
MQRMQVSLRLTSGLMSPEQMSEELGIVADRIWRKGERRGATNIVEKENGCEFRAATATGESLEEQADILLRRLNPIADKVRAMRCDDVQLTCAMYASEVPALHFSAATIQALSRLGASIDVDLYVSEGNWSE